MFFFVEMFGEEDYKQSQVTVVVVVAAASLAHCLSTSLIDLVKMVSTVFNNARIIR